MTKRNKTLTLLIFLISLVVLFWSGCEGPQGPEGQAGLGVDDLDPVPPEITLIHPGTGADIVTDTFTFAASASDNDSLAFVEFFVDGISSMGALGTARDSTPPYRVVWNLDSSGHGSGFHLLTARAFDLNNNYADTPTSWINRVPMNRLEILFHDGIGDAVYAFLPDIYYDKNFNVRFTPLDTCRLLTLFYEFGDPAALLDTTLNGGCDIQFRVWDSNPLGLPNNLLLDTLVVEDDIEYNRWYAVEVDQYDFGFAGDFHAGFTPADDLYSFYLNNNRGVALVANDNPSLFNNSNNHRSSEFEGGNEDGTSGRGWGTFQEQWGFRLDFHIRVLVDYFEAGTMVLTPDGRKIPAPGETSEVIRLLEYSERIKLNN